MNIIFAGTPEFALPSLRGLLESAHRVLAVYTQPDRPKGRGRRLLMSPVKQFALQKQLAICQPATLRDSEEQKKLASWQADVMVVVAYGLLLPRPVLAIPSLGCINVHASLLPRWRGAAPIQRAILAGDNETGISIMRMDEGLDTGPILQQVVCKIAPQETSQSLQNRLAELGARALQISLNAIEKGTCQLELQNDQASTYAKKIQKTEACIDWTQNAENIARKVRAFNPKPVAYTVIGDLSLRVWAAKVLDHMSGHAAPGTIIKVSEQGIDVMTRQGCLRLLQLQLPGGRPLLASELLHSKSHLFKIGHFLG